MRRVILDVDVGTDDYLALLLFLQAEAIGKVKIEAIVCTNGNTTVDNVCTNVVRLLELAKRTDIPVYRGSPTQLIPPKEPIKLFHGKDGFGELEHDTKPDVSIVRKEPAAQAMRNLAVQHPNEISFICLAPLTNVALATRLYDDFADNIKDLWLMGGNHTGMGNTTAAAEFNFYVDPEAANIVLNSIKKPMTMLTWETCLKQQITFQWRYEVFGVKENPMIQLLNRAEKAVYKDKSYEEFWLPCDAFLACAYLYGFRYIKKRSEHYATVELHGYETRGQMILDHLNERKEKNVTIIEEINGEIFKVVIKNEL